MPKAKIQTRALERPFSLLLGLITMKGLKLALNLVLDACRDVKRDQNFT